MRNEFFNYEDITQLSSRDKAYQASDERLREFYHFPFQYDELTRAIEERRKFPVDRNLLVNELTRQYKGISQNEQVSKNISLLQSDNSFTIITAHQPSLLTGPLYYILKICSAINLAKRLSESTGMNIIPMFVLGAEDHDFDEINHLQLYGKTVTWERISRGSVGRLNLDGLDEVVKQVSEILGDSVEANKLVSHMAFAQKDSSTYGEFMFKFTHAIFHEYGLIVANFDNIAFKKAFIPLIKKEVLNQFSKPLVTASQEKIKDVGFSDQAYAREINFFYLDEKGRNRIEKVGEKYKILETDLVFTEKEITAEIEQYPEKFSPNVVMRPLFQELIMPNLAYIGGGGELAYWMERKEQFQEAGIFYPMLIRRNSAVWVNKRVQKDLKKLDLTFEDLLTDTDALLKEYALQQSVHDVDFQAQIDALDEIYEPLSQSAKAIDPTLVGRIEAMKTVAGKEIDKIQTRLIRSIKHNQEVALNKVIKTKDALFPNNSLQERKSNFMEFYLSNGDAMIDYLVEVCDPFQKGFMVIYEE